SISFDGQELTRLGAQARAGLGIGYVPQGREIFPRLSVEENLKVGLGLGRTGLRKVPDQVYELFPVLAQMRQRRGGDLSGGQQQQLAIGRALVLEPTLLILDEPTEGIQPNIVRDIGDILLDLNQRLGMTILLVEQKLSFARRVADRFAIMDKGRVAASGNIDDLDSDLVSAHLSV
ncbi:MAG: ATP-binding cassette domain-containing protein, partial [Rhodocyclaceae bacterium]|nr:ATP-binding cassette domain-containing protein [Rhodocyclaceae bacterium]